MPGRRAMGGDERFQMAVDTFFRLEEFETAEMLGRGVDRLKQWIGDQEPLPDWKRDPLAAPWTEGIGGLADPVERAAGELMGPADQLELKDLVTRLEQLAQEMALDVNRLEGLAGRMDLAEVDRFSSRLRRVAVALGASTRLHGQGVIDFLTWKLQYQKEVEEEEKKQELQAVEDALKQSEVVADFVALDTLDGQWEERLGRLDRREGRLGEIAKRGSNRALAALAKELGGIERQLQEGWKGRKLRVLRSGLDRLTRFTGPEKLDQLARREDRRSLAQVAARLAAPSQPLQEAAAEARQLAEKLDEGQLLLFAAYLQRLEQQQQDLGSQLAKLAEGTERTSLHQQLGVLAEQVGRLRRLRQDLTSPLRYLAEIDELTFTRTDGFTLQEAVWLRDVAHWVVGEERDAVAQASRLFDWTVRNIQLDGEPVSTESEPVERIMEKPWEVLLFGHGTAQERAWVFVLLARQLGLDAFQLARVEEDEEGSRLVPWAVGVLDGDELYLFDPTLGLPIPAPDGVQWDDRNGLRIRPATLSQVVADDALLRQLDLSPERRYPVSAKDVQGVVALLEASPAYVSQRMALVERRLAGRQRIVLTCDPAVQAERVKKCRHVADARIWSLPYRTLVQSLRLASARSRWQLTSLLPFQVPIGGAPVLSTARVLHLKGRLHGSPSAVEFYQRARIPNRELNREDFDPETRSVCIQAKQHASYWLGLVAAEQGNYRSALDYLLNRVLQETPGGPWTAGARYNVARIYEADGKPEAAIEQYVLDVSLPGSYGNVLRARWLAAHAPTVAGQPGEGRAAEPTGEEPVLPALPGTERQRQPVLPTRPDSDAEPVLPGLPDPDEPANREQPDPAEEESVLPGLEMPADDKTAATWPVTRAETR